MRYLIVFLLVFTLAGCSKEEKIASVDGRAVSQTAFEAFLKFKRHRVEDDKRRAALLDQYLEREALAAAIEKASLLDKALIDAELNEFRKEMLISRYFETYLKDKVGQDAVRNYYATHAGDYEERQVRVAHILIRTNAKMSEPERKAKLTTAQEACSLIRSGKAFEKIAEQYSEDKVSAKKGGDLGWIKEGGVHQQFSKVAFELEEGTVSEPFETPFGFHVIKVLSAPRLVKRPFEGVAGDIRFQLRNKAKKAELERLLDTVKVEKSK
jgi:peptidyl-prolyl cis-trans isomerase C